MSMRRQCEKSGVGMLASALVWMTVFVARAAGPWYVATNGVDTGNDGLSWSQPLATISSAIAKAGAVANETIWVSNGVYAVGATITNPLAKACQIRAWSTNAADTVLLGPGSNDVVNFRGVWMSGAGSLLQGFTVTKFYLTNENAGAGVWCNAGIISNCMITCNFLCFSNTYSVGGGIYLQGGGSVLNCDVIGNTNFHTANISGGGGGVYAGGGNCRIINCRLLRNRTNVMGGGIHANGTGNIIRDCTVAYNRSTQDGGICGGDLISNCVVVANTSAWFGGIGVQYTGVKNVSIIDCVVSNNSTGNGGAVWIGNDSASSWPVTNAFVYRCTIVSNFCSGSTMGGLYAGATTAKYVIRNCLVANNYVSSGNATPGAAGIQADGTNIVVESCTVVSNVLAASRTGSAGGLFVTNSVRVVNTIIFDNRHTGGVWTNVAAAADCTFSNCCTAPLSAIAGAANTEGDPRFVSKETGNFSLKGDSSCINAGVYQAWMQGAVDLNRSRRVSGLQVDIGAYEYISKGTFIGIY